MVKHPNRKKKKKTFSKNWAQPIYRNADICALGRKRNFKSKQSQTHAVFLTMSVCPGQRLGYLREKIITKIICAILWNVQSSAERGGRARTLDSEYYSVMCRKTHDRGTRSMYSEMWLCGYPEMWHTIWIMWKCNRQCGNVADYMMIYTGLDIFGWRLSEI